MHRQTIRLSRPIVLLAGAAAVALLTAACGSSGGGAASSASAPGGAAGSAAAAGGNSSTSASVTTMKKALRIETHSAPMGTFLTDGSGDALYMFAADSHGKSACTGACTTYWPPLTVHGKAAVAGSAKAADLGLITRSDGSKQVTYAGHPLYYYAGDRKPGDTNGQGSNNFGAKWWLLAPSGRPIAKGSSGGAGSSPSKSGSGGGGGTWG